MRKADNAIGNDDLAAAAKEANHVHRTRAADFRGTRSVGKDFATQMQDDNFPHSSLQVGRKMIAATDVKEIQATRTSGARQGLCGQGVHH